MMTPRSEYRYILIFLPSSRSTSRQSAQVSPLQLTVQDHAEQSASITGNTAIRTDLTETRPEIQFEYAYANKNTSPENHQIRLTVTNVQGCDTSWTENMTVYPEIRAAFNMDADAICYPSLTSFINNTKPAIPLTWYWEFGDGSSSVSRNPEHAFKNYSRTDDQTFYSKVDCDLRIWL